LENNVRQASQLFGSSIYCNITVLISRVAQVAGSAVWADCSRYPIVYNILGCVFAQNHSSSPLFCQQLVTPSWKPNPAASVPVVSITISFSVRFPKPLSSFVNVVPSLKTRLQNGFASIFGVVPSFVVVRFSSGRRQLQGETGTQVAVEVQSTNPAQASSIQSTIQQVTSASSSGLNLISAVVISSLVDLGIVASSDSSSIASQITITAPTLSSCQNYVWTDSVGRNCSHYSSSGACNAGVYGTGWNLAQFQLYAKNRVDATVACCECGGGIKDTSTSCPSPGQCKNLQTYIIQTEALAGPRIFCNLTYLQSSIVSVASSSQWTVSGCANTAGVFSALNCTFQAYHTNVDNTMSCTSPGSALSTQALLSGSYLFVYFQLSVPAVSPGTTSTIDYLNQPLVLSSLKQNIATIVGGISSSQIYLELLSGSRRELFGRDLQTSGAIIAGTVSSINEAQQANIYQTLKANQPSNITWSLLQQALASALSRSSVPALSSVQIQSLVTLTRFIYPFPYTSACQDFTGWADIRGTPCNSYASSNLCTLAGGYGPGWFDYAGGFSFAQLASIQGRVPAVRACCACGGGLVATTAQPLSGAGIGGATAASLSSVVKVQKVVMIMTAAVILGLVN